MVFMFYFYRMEFVACSFFFSFSFFNEYDVENCDASKVRCHNIMKSTKSQLSFSYIHTYIHIYIYMYID